MLAAFENRPLRYDPAEIPRAGVFVSIDPEGHVAVERGYVRPEDEPTPAPNEDSAEEGPCGSDGTAIGAPAVQRTIITVGGEKLNDDDDDAIKPLPERLVGELTAHRTLALRDAVANNPHVAMTALLHKLCLDAFQHSALGACLEVSVRHVFFPVQAPDLKDSLSAKAVAERQKAWKAELPKDDDALWDWLSDLDDDRRAALLAHCVSFGVNALYEKGDRYGGPGVSVHGVQQRLAQADRLARAVGLDMVAAGWRPTVDNYLGRVTKPRIQQRNGEPGTRNMAGHAESTARSAACQALGVVLIRDCEGPCLGEGGFRRIRDALIGLAATGSEVDASCLADALDEVARHREATPSDRVAVVQALATTVARTTEPFDAEHDERIAYALAGVVAAGDVAPREAADRFVMAQPFAGSARLNAKHVPAGDRRAHRRSGLLRGGRPARRPLIARKRRAAVAAAPW